MSEGPGVVFQAIERWQQKQLVSTELAATLRDEVEASSRVGTQRLTQYVLAATGAVVLLIAAGVFLDWAWPQMTDATRTGLLVGVGLGVHLWGVRLESQRRWVPASYLMQAAGLGVLLIGALYSKEAWDDMTTGGIAMGILSLAIPAVLAPRSLRRGAVMPAVHLCFALAFIALFFDRVSPLDGDAIIWIIDGVLLLASLYLILALSRDPAGQRHPWALNAFVAALYAGFLLIAMTGTGPLDMDASVMYPLDGWLVLAAGLTLWGIHRAPPGLRRSWFELHLALCVLLWIPLGFATVGEAMEAESEVALLLVGGVGVAGFLYGVRHGVREVFAASALAFICAIWFWAVDRAGALGAVAALGVTAALLFWSSGRDWVRSAPAAHSSEG